MSPDFGPRTLRVPTPWPPARDATPARGTSAPHRPSFPQTALAATPATARAALPAAPPAAHFTAHAPALPLAHAYAHAPPIIRRVPTLLSQVDPPPRPMEGRAVRVATWLLATTAAALTVVSACLVTLVAIPPTPQLRVADVRTYTPRPAREAGDDARFTTAAPLPAATPSLRVRPATSVGSPASDETSVGPPMPDDPAMLLEAALAP
jgi:hypothetical protein